MTKRPFDPTKCKQVKCMDSYHKGVEIGICEGSPTLNHSEYQLIEESINYYTNSLNNGRGVPIVNTLAGKLLAYLEEFVPFEEWSKSDLAKRK